MLVLILKYKILSIVLVARMHPICYFNHPRCCDIANINLFVIIVDATCGQGALHQFTTAVVLINIYTGASRFEILVAYVRIFKSQNIRNYQ